ncbi:MAG: rhodanese-like domain-containing protein [Candidatus Synoicihabitans palmerolidicus]|nr:rhodanese-like domain-containing protein [Candidatus Synoicihabitans palmerolidicus]
MVNLILPSAPSLFPAVIMKLLALIALAFVFFAVVRTALGQSSSKVLRLPPSEAAAQAKAGTAIVVDVREPAEWTSGVVAPAYLLPLSDLRASRAKWAHVLATAKAEDKTVLLYCRSGQRSGQAASLLAREGYCVANLGGFRDWQAANLPTRSPDAPAGNN